MHINTADESEQVDGEDEDIRWRKDPRKGISLTERESPEPRAQLEDSSYTWKDFSEELIPGQQVSCLLHPTPWMLPEAFPFQYNPPKRKT